MPGTDLAISFFTILTVLANLAVAALAVMALLLHGRRDAATTGPLRRAAHLVRGELQVDGATIAWLVAATATAGSLYFSEVAGFIPCRLCWIQRGLMYPLVLVLPVARLWPAARLWARRLGLGLAGAGAVVATYHLFVERFPSLESGTCDPAVPCSLIWFERLGFVTLPYMALSAFVLVAGLLLASSGSVPAAGPALPSDQETIS